MRKELWLTPGSYRDAIFALAVTATGIALVSGLLWLTPAGWHSTVVGTVYSLWLGAALGYASLRGGLTAVGLSTRRLWLGLPLAVGVALLGVAGSLADPSMEGASLRLPAPLVLIAMVIGTFAPAFAEQLVFCGLLQKRFSDTFGPAAGVLAYAIVFTCFHLALIWLPGAVPPGGDDLPRFAAGLLVGSAVAGGLFAVTQNVWVMTLAGGTNAFLLNLYRLSVHQEDVLVADPSTITSGVFLIAGWLLALSLVARAAVPVCRCGGLEHRDMATRI